MTGIPSPIYTQYGKWQCRWWNIQFIVDCLHNFQWTGSLILLYFSLFKFERWYSVLFDLAWINMGNGFRFHFLFYFFVQQISEFLRRLSTRMIEDENSYTWNWINHLVLICICFKKKIEKKTNKFNDETLKIYSIENAILFSFAQFKSRHLNSTLVCTRMEKRIGKTSK